MAYTIDLKEKLSLLQLSLCNDDGPCSWPKASAAAKLISAVALSGDLVI